MPGVSFKAHATHLSHWAAHLSAAAAAAARLPAKRRREMVAEALARRFPAGAMMAAYADAWEKVGARDYILIAGPGFGRPRRTGAGSRGGRCSGTSLREG